MCYFAHPTDGEQWRNARPSGEPPLQYLTDDEYRLIVGRHRSPGRAPPYIPHHHHHHPQSAVASAAGARRRTLSLERRRPPSPNPAASGVRRRSDSRERALAPAASSPTLAQRLRGRRSVSREREQAAGRAYGQRSSRSRSPVLRGRLRTPPPRVGAAPVGPPRAPRPYGSIPDGPRNGGSGGGGVGPGHGMPNHHNSNRSPMFPKNEAVDVTMRDVGTASLKASYARESSIASTRVPSQQPSPSRVPAPASVSMTGMATDTLTVPQQTASAAVSSSSSIPTPESINTLLESSQLQWKQISSAVAAATSAVPKATTQSAGHGDLSAEEKNKIWSSRVE